MKVDTVIVGAGTAGRAALREVRRATDDFVVVNDGHWGTTCAEAGCMPSKALIEAANAYHRRHALAAFGIRGAEALAPDPRSVLSRVRALRDGFTAGLKALPDELGDRAITGRARLDGPNRIVVAGREITARAIILAPGSSPVVPEPWRDFGDRVLTTDTLFDQPDLPRRIAVIGLGPVGLELAQALARLGCRVTGVDTENRPGGLDDPDLSDVLCACLGEEMDLRLGAQAELAEADRGALRLDGIGAPVTADAVLAAIGRRPNIAGLGLETLDIALDERGMPEIDPETLRLGDHDVFLAGDGNGRRPILHEAADEGFIAGRMASSGAPDGGVARRTPLSVTFVDPQVAQVGTPASRIPASRRVTAEADFSRQARARMAVAAKGRLRVHADGQTGRLLGAEMCVPEAEHLAHFLALAITSNLTVADLLATPIYHPTVAEGLRGALRDLDRRLPRQGGAELSRCDDIGDPALD